MAQTIAVTSKWQIHIPVNIRQALGWTKPSQAIISLKNKVITIKPKKSSILDLAGKFSHLKPGKKIDIDNIRDYIDYSDI